MHYYLLIPSSFLLIDHFVCFWMNVLAATCPASQSICMDFDERISFQESTSLNTLLAEVPVEILHYSTVHWKRQKLLYKLLVLTDMLTLSGLTRRPKDEAHEWMTAALWGPKMKLAWVFLKGNEYEVAVHFVQQVCIQLKRPHGLVAASNIDRSINPLIYCRTNISVRYHTNGKRLSKVSDTLSLL